MTEKRGGSEQPREVIVRRGARIRQTKTREALLAATRRIMARESRAAFTIDEVVQMAGVAKGSFYNHFPDKEAIAAEVYRAVREMEEVEVAKVNVAELDPVARVARGMAVYARMALTASEDARILTLNQFDSQFLLSGVNEGLVTDLREALRCGRIVIPSVEAAEMLVVGQVAVLIARLGGEADPASALLVSQQCIAITLVGVGLSHRDAQLLATQATDYILRDNERLDLG